MLKSACHEWPGGLLKNIEKFPLPFFPMAFTPMVPTQELHSAAANERARIDLDFSMTFMQIEPYSLDLTNANMFMNWSLN